MIKKIYSKTDGSVNWIIPYKNSFVEARYVRRSPHYISAYLSSHNGCKMECKFCWLTATKQKEFNHTTQDIYSTQLNYILEHSKKIDSDLSSDIRINVNLMARGEALANKYIINQYPIFYNNMKDLVNKYNYKELKVNLSTIIPYTVKDYELFYIFKNIPTNIYYSLYSIDPIFRKKWMPNAIPWQLALDKLKKYQFLTNNPITFHYAIIEGENDKIEEIKKMTDEIKKFSFNHTKFNIVRFNPHPSMKEYKEPSEDKLKSIYEILKSVANDSNIKTNKSRIVPRADQLTRSSCGMFITKDEYDDI